MLRKRKTEQAPPALQIKNLSKRYGKARILNDISFEVNKGEVVGFVGRNGAGKTTTIRLIMGLTKPSSGNVLIHGVPTGSPRALQYTSFLSERPAFYGSFSGIRNIKICLLGANKPFKRHEVERNMDRVAILDAANRAVNAYSKGMLTRLGIAHAMSRNPDVYIFDEPGTGLDPIGIKIVRDIMRELADSGGAVLFSSHLLSEIERICDRIVVIDKGKIITQGRLDEIHQPERRVYSVFVGAEDAERALRLLGSHAEMSRRDHVLTVSDLSGREISKKLCEAGIFPDEIHQINDDLDIIFSRLTSSNELS